MNILLFSWRDPKHPLAGGAEQVVHEHCKGWIKAGHGVTLFSSLIEGLEGKEVLDGVEIIRGGYQYLGVQWVGFWFYLRNHHRFDLVIDQFHGLPFFTPLYVRKPRLALIQETARKVWFLNPLPWPLNWIIGALGYITEPLVFWIYKSTLFMTGSKSAKKDVSKMGIPLENITVVPHGVILPKLKTKNLKPKTKNSVRTVVFLGVLSKDKGIEDAIKCFKILDKQSFLLRNKKGVWNFWVIGRPETPEYSQEIEALIKRLRFKNKIKFWGFVSLEKKFELLSRAHVLVNPSVHEGWGLVNIEANAMGTPVVAYSNAGLVDSVKDGKSGILVKENTPENLALEIENLQEDAQKYQKLKKGAIAWSKNFTWSKSRKLSLKLIESLT